nr:hypothetical protein [Tanacetum cinerariifolium]
MRMYFLSRALQDFIVERPEDDSLDTPMKDKEELPDSTNRSKNLQANVDSRLVANQVNGTYIAKKLGMIKYLEKVKNLTNTFKAFSIKQEKSIEEKEVLMVVEEEGRTWMTSISEYPTKEILLEEKRKARAISCKACRYAMTNGVLQKPKIRGGKSSKIMILLANYARRGHEINKGVQKLSGPGKVKFLIVAIDYFTKWIEAKLVATITRAQHLQANILVEKGKQEFRNAIFVDVWNERGDPSRDWHANLEKCESGHDKNDEALEINLDLLEERREHAAIQEAKSKAKMEKYYNVRVRNTSFKPGDLVYRNNKASHAEDIGKLGPK